MTVKRYLIPLASAGVLLAACSTSPVISNGPGATAPSSAATAAMGANDTITIKSSMYSSISVAPGAQVSVVNTDRVQHTLTIKGEGIDLPLGSGEQGVFTAPARPGTYELTCDLHPAMHGTLTVTG